jgi:hypothetical protein
MELKPTKITAVFMPRTMGIFILLIIVLSFAAGAIRREMVLTLTGAVFFAVWVYCLAMTLLLAMFQRRRAARVSIHLAPEKIVSGGWTQVNYSEVSETSGGAKIFQFPLIVVRCRVPLKTKDGRRASYDFKPEPARNFSQAEAFQVKKRGAYFSAYDELAVFDILGFFRFAFRIPSGRNALLVSPHAATELFPVRARGGESDRQDAPAFERTDDLIDHRPYVPGDDPRRINWKLYSHGGELFIRQGELQPPPHSNITILIDTQFDSLYTTKSAPDAVDLLCENALAIINSAGKDKDVKVGFTGQSEGGGDSLTAAEPGFFLAYPYAAHSAVASATAHAGSPPFDLPQVPQERAVIILALPRVSGNKYGGEDSSALDRFLSKNENRAVELIFIYDASESRVSQERAQAAETCVSIYNRRPGVRAQAFGTRIGTQ